MGDFTAGSYNISVYMANDKRSNGNTDSDQFIAGLVDVYDYGGYYEAGLLSRDAKGLLHAFQYYPRVDKVMPARGSKAGGTVIVIQGGGFSMNVDDVDVRLGQRKCIVTFASNASLARTSEAHAIIPKKRHEGFLIPQKIVRSVAH